MVKSNEQVCYPFYTDYRPLNIMRNGKKIAGWRNTSYSVSNQQITIDDTYNDFMDYTLNGKIKPQVPSSDQYQIKYNSKLVNGHPTYGGTMGWFMYSSGDYSVDSSVTDHLKINLTANGGKRDFSMSTEMLYSTPTHQYYKIMRVRVNPDITNTVVLNVVDRYYINGTPSEGASYIYLRDGEWYEFCQSGSIITHNYWEKSELEIRTNTNPNASSISIDDTNLKWIEIEYIDVVDKAELVGADHINDIDWTEITNLFVTTKGDQNNQVYYDVSFETAYTKPAELNPNNPVDVEPETVYIGTNKSYAQYDNLWFGDSVNQDGVIFRYSRKIHIYDLSWTKSGENTFYTTITDRRNNTDVFCNSYKMINGIGADYGIYLPNNNRVYIKDKDINSVDELIARRGYLNLYYISGTTRREQTEPQRLRTSPYHTMVVSNAEATITLKKLER